MTKKETAIATKQEMNMVMGSADLGFENFTAEDMIIPRLRLMQPSSDDVVGNKCKAGEFQDSLTGDILGTEVEVVLLKMQNGAVLFGDKTKGEEGMLCRSPDGIMSMNGDVCKDCPFGEYHMGEWKEEKPPRCSSTKDFTIVTRLSLSGLENRPMVMTFRRTSYKAGKSLATMAMFTGKHIAATPYIVYSEFTKNAKGPHFLLRVRKAEKQLTDEELANAMQWASLVRMANVKVHDDTQAAEVVDDESI